MSPFVTGMSFRTGVASLSSAGTWFSVDVGHSCWYGNGVRWTRFLVIVLVCVSTLHDRGVDAASMNFPERWRSSMKTSVPGPIEGKGLALCLLLNTVFCFILLMLCRTRRLSKSCHCGFSWVWNNGTLFLICLLISNWAGENLHASGVERWASNAFARSFSFVRRFFTVLTARSTAPLLHLLRVIEDYLCYAWIPIPQTEDHCQIALALGSHVLQILT